MPHKADKEVVAMGTMGKKGSRTAEARRFVAGWMEDRTGAVSGLARFLNHPAPKRGAWMYALGTATLFLMTLQFLTGILLTVRRPPRAGSPTGGTPWR